MTNLLRPIRSIRNATARLLARDRIFVLALSLSLAWHLAWFWAIALKPPSADRHSVKFSSVSFLGSLFKGDSLQVRMSPRERLPQEKRLNERILALVGGSLDNSKIPARGLPEPEKVLFERTDAIEAARIPEILGLTKREPGRDLNISAGSGKIE